MAVIVPTITTSDLAVYNENMAKFSAFCKRIQVDISDGSFAPTATVQLQDVSFPDGIEVDLHLMSARPSEHLATILALKPSLCILHAEVDDNLTDVFGQLREAGIKIGVALIKTTFPGKVAELITLADHVMIFDGELGQQGGTVDLMQIEKVALIRNIKGNVEVGWDGGVNLSNVRAIAHAGVDVLNVGSAITQAADPGAMYQSLITESEKKGVLV